jgi:hypothetical protein
MAINFAERLLEAAKFIQRRQTNSDNTTKDARKAYLAQDIVVGKRVRGRRTILGMTGDLCGVETPALH